MKKQLLIISLFAASFSFANPLTPEVIVDGKEITEADLPILQATIIAKQGDPITNQEEEFEKINAGKPLFEKRGNYCVYFIESLLAPTFVSPLKRKGMTYSIIKSFEECRMKKVEDSTPEDAVKKIDCFHEKMEEKGYFFIPKETISDPSIYCDMYPNAMFCKKLHKTILDYHKYAEIQMFIACKKNPKHKNCGVFYGNRRAAINYLEEKRRNR